MCGRRSGHAPESTHLRSCEGAGGVGLALRLGIGHFWSKEPLDLGFAVADAAVARGVLTYRAVSIAIDSNFLWAIGVPLCVRVSYCPFKSIFIAYGEFLGRNRIDTS